MSTTTLTALPQQRLRRRTDAPGYVGRDLGSADAATKRIELWSPWGARGLPGTAADEAAFIARAKELAGASELASAADRGGAADPGGPISVRRHHVNALVTALRCSVTADEVLRLAPGIRAEMLLAAHEALDSRRIQATAAWERIVGDPSPMSIRIDGAMAARIAPVAMSHVHAYLARNAGDAPGLAAAVGRIDRELRTTRELGESLEARLDSGTLTDAAATQIGDRLYDAFGEGVWSMSTFMSRRVGTLVPARLATLLQEDQTARAAAADSVF
ncbi:MAG: hypothetical protein JWL72_1379 [Ilumatobacteraceae bacterium]|nr:hypothetical protein [Ilumatobacteraceae bacterium]